MNLTNTFGNNTKSKPNPFYPEPGFLITITPTFYQGLNGADGQRVFITGISDPITQIQIEISNTQHITTLISEQLTLAKFEGIFIKSIDCENCVVEKPGGGSIELTVVNFSSIDYSSSSNQMAILYDSIFDLSSPLIDLFKPGFLINIQMFNPFDNATNFVDLYTGVIGDPSYLYDENNLNISLPIDSFLTILNRSANIQTSENQKLGSIQLNTITSQLYVFDNLLKKLLDETIISEYLSSILYFKAPNETLAIGDTGTAINENSKIYAFTAPTSSKLQLIMETLYAYQRAFYIDNAGNIVISPLQAYFNIDENWRFTFIEEENFINGFRINPIKRTASVQNRAALTLLQLYTLFNETTNTASIVANAIAVATPNPTYFPRLSEFVTSGKYLQTLFGVQEINPSILQNSGLLNIAKLRPDTITGLVNNGVLINNNFDVISTADADLNNLKFYLNLYAGKALAEQLFTETQVEIEVPTNLTYNTQTNKFREIPLNELVLIPAVNNYLFDGIQEYFCFGYKFSYSRQKGAIIKLMLTKPYTYMLLWSQSKLELA